LNHPGSVPIAVYVPALGGGGSEINAMRLASWFIADGHAVDLVVHDRSGHVSKRIPKGVRVVVLRPSSEAFTRLHMLYAAIGNPGLFAQSFFRSRRQLDKLLYLPDLVRYLKREQPSILFSNLWQLNINAVTARACAAPKMPVVCIFRSAYFHQCAQHLENAKRPRKWLRFLAYCQSVYSQADALVTVSSGVASDLRDIVGVPPERVQVIYNPSAAPEVPDMASQPPNHPWFDDGQPPVILAVGRLSPEKRFDAMIDAFAAIREQGIDTRLVILGEGPDRTLLEARVARHNLTEYVAMPGWADNPYSFMRRCGVFVLCSDTEGLPTALIEAMACGCPVVAYDCPHGPREILADGQHGKLVPIGDATALTEAIVDTLGSVVDRDALVRRAQTFSAPDSAAAYRKLLSRLVN